MHVILSQDMTTWIGWACILPASSRGMPQPLYTGSMLSGMGYLWPSSAHTSSIDTRH